MVYNGNSVKMVLSHMSATNKNNPSFFLAKDMFIGFSAWRFPLFTRFGAQMIFSKGDLVENLARGKIF